ncbi:MAG: LPS export ABC transporter permease LptG [Betaproteobacteria bacterium]|nr:LPS export ABC transporter permease LptG [Betaproteobacteria bacterium]MDE2623151.1 LPS export ABC transporter permease LptG [Betaproteobacteria bacterium]
MRLLNRYLAREVLMGTGLVLMALLFLFSFFDLIHELNDLGKGSYQLWQMFVFVALALPGHAYELFPIAALIGTLYGLSTLAAHSEITVMRTSGMSRNKLAGALVRVGLLFVLVAFLLGELIMPVSEEAAQQWRLKALNNFVATQFRSGIWVKDKGNFINVREMLPDNSLRDLRIYEFDEEHRLRRISTARKAVYQQEHLWLLSNVERTVFDARGVHVEHEASAQWDSVLTPQVMSTLLVEPEQMSVWNLFAYIRHLRDNSQQTVRFEIAEWSKLLYPFSILVMMMLALPFALQRPRSGAVGMRVMIGIGLGLSFYLVSRFFSYMGQLNDWSPAMSTLAPSVLFLGIAALLGWWTERNA